MSNERNADSINALRVTRDEDGVYRWMYEMDMKENRSILYTVCKIMGWICLGLYVLFLLLFGMETGFRLNTILIVTGGSVVITAILMGLCFLIFFLCALIMRGTYRIRYEMGETGMEMFQSMRRKTTREARRARGGIPTMTDVVSQISYTEVRRVRLRPKWNMIDLGLTFGGFQVYAPEEDLQKVLNYILKRVPEKARSRYSDQ